MQKKEEKQVCHSTLTQCKDFETFYDRACAIRGTHPLSAVKTFLDDRILDINADRINTEDWKPICEALTIKHKLKFVAIRSFSKNKTTRDKKDEDPKITSKTLPIHTQAIVHNLLASISCSLRLTSSLTCLELQNLPLALPEIGVLGQSLSQNHSIQHLSLHQCLIGDNGLEVLFKVVKNSFNITSANFSSCGLTWKSAHTVVNLLKHQTISRHSEAWKETLRHEIANLDAMGGMQRLTLNKNPLIGDKGAHILAEILREDIWLKAIDIQQCGIQESGAKALLNSLKYNTTLYILDIRENAIRDHNLLLRIIQQLCFNVQGQTSQFKWLTIAKPRGKCSMRGERVVNKKRGIPWRVAARCSLARNLNLHTPGVASVFCHSSPSLMGCLSEETSDSMSTCNKSMKRRCSKRSSARRDEVFNAVKAELAQLKQLLFSEKAARDRAEKRIHELLSENDTLKRCLTKKTSATLDDTTVDTIEATFKKFNDFLQLLRNVGYGSLVDVAGMALKSTSAEMKNFNFIEENSPEASEKNKLEIIQKYIDSKSNNSEVSQKSDSHVNNPDLSPQNKGLLNSTKHSNNKKGPVESKFEQGTSSERQFRNELNSEKVYTYLSSDWSKLEISSKRQTSSIHSISNQRSTQNSKTSGENSARSSDSIGSHPVDVSGAANFNSTSSILTRSSTTSSPESLGGIITVSDKF